MNRLSPEEFVKYVYDNKDNPEKFENIDQMLPGYQDNLCGKMSLLEQLEYFKENSGPVCKVFEIKNQDIMSLYRPVRLLGWGTDIRYFECLTML